MAAVLDWLDQDVPTVAVIYAIAATVILIHVAIRVTDIVTRRQTNILQAKFKGSPDA